MPIAMEEVRQLVQEEGREARNLVAFHVSVDTPASARISRKPPRVSPLPATRRPRPPPARLRSASAGRDKRSELRARYWALLFGDLQRAIGEIYNTVEAHENLNECQEVILVLENYTRDFKALGEWFRLKWEYDNTPPPQRPQSLAWEIRKTDFVRPESRRAHSVKSSPSVSGKNSPSLSGHNTPSGKNSPNLTGKSSPGSGKISPRVNASHSNSSPKANIEFFSSKLAASKNTAKPEPRSAKEASRLSDIKEKDVKDTSDEIDSNVKVLSDVHDNIQDFKVEIGKAKECPKVCPKQVIIKSPKKSSNDSSKKANNNDVSYVNSITSKLDEMENVFLAKNIMDNIKNDNMLNAGIVENGFVDDKSLHESEIPVDEIEKDTTSSESPSKSEDNFADISTASSSKSNEDIPFKDGKEGDKKEITQRFDCDAMPVKSASNSSVINKNHIKTTNKITTQICGDNLLKEEIGGAKTENNNEMGNEEDSKTDIFEDIKPTQHVLDGADDGKKVETSKSHVETKASSKPAYSQAAAKPKLVNTTKNEIKTPTRSATAFVRSKTVVEIRPGPAPKTQTTFAKKNPTNKCSYPFNLTTGRTSLFDTGIKVAPKRPLNRNVNMASGDSKSQTKVEPKKRPPRPTCLKINEKGDKKDKISPTLEKIKDCDEYSSSDTIVTQIDMSRIESSESLKTLVPEELQMMNDVATSIEVLNVDSNKSDNEGWLTVKSRRLSRESKKQSKSHWANRFNQPSATTSLPTLNMLESPKQETKSILNAPSTSKFNRAQSEQPQPVEKFEKVVKVVEKPKPESPKAEKPKFKDPAMIRQKSDVTGLRTRSARNKALSKKDKSKGMPKDEDGSELMKNRLHSSLESLTTGLARSQESTEEAFDFDKWKAEFKSTFKYLDDDDQMANQTEILKSADPSEMSEIAEMTSQIEENERKISLALDFQSEEDQRKLCEEEDLLNRQILELQQVSDIDLDTETDDTETDAEIQNEDVATASTSADLGALAASLEDQYESALAGMSWAERIDTLVVLEALVARDPGRAQQLHAKLSQGIKRRGSLQDALRRLQAKQARAERQRLEYRTQRSKKIHQLLARVEEVKVAKNQLIEEKRLRMERRLQKAAENRDQHLKDRVRKAHDEEEKLREIAFIKQLEAENRRHEFLEQCRSHTTRLRLMRRDRLTKLEQKAAREAAVGARRLAIEAARKLHVETLLEKKKERDARVEELKELKKQERDDAAREKAEGVKSRLSALAAAAELEADALRSRIRDKQDASQQRLESHLQAIREKATGPRQPTTSDSQDTTTRELEEEAERLEQERKEREKQKAIKKKARKVKQKLLTTNSDSSLFEETSYADYNPISNKMYKVLQQLNNLIAPLIDTENNQNGVEIDDIDKQKKHKKNKMTNGDVDNDKKKGKKKKGNDEKVDTDDKTKDNVELDEDNSKPKKKKDGKSDKNNKTNDENIKVDPDNNIQTNGIEKEEVKVENNKKRNKKKGNEKSEKSKLSKTSSVCSSLSDMSKVSGKSERKNRVVIDTNYLERQLNELHRMLEKVDKSSHLDRLTFQKCHGLKTLGQFLAVVAEREDLAAQFTARCVGTAVTALCRAVAASPAAARLLLSASACVHLAKLLADRLDKELQYDQREMELSRQLCDCLSVALDSVLIATRLHDEHGGQDVEVLAALRSRAHTLISYICLCGCITRAETAGEARESIQTLLTVCADLCQPCDADTGPERLSALQSLRCALGTSICGSRAELCMLFAQGAGLDHCSGFVRAARTAHLLRALAELDHQIVQDAFGEGGWALEFRAAVARLLTQHAPTDKEAPRNSALRLSNQRLDQTLSETMVLDLIVLVGFVVVNHPQLQETICDGWSVIKTLCTLPANWLVSKPHCHALLPTLLALSERPATAAAIAAELSVGMLEEYLDSREAQKIKLVQVIKQGRGKKNGKK